MEYFGFSDIIVSFLVFVFYIVIFYLIVKQLYRNISFGDAILDFKKKKNSQKHRMLSLFFYVILVVIYLMVIYRDLKLDMDTAIICGYYDRYQNAMILKIALSLIPLFLFILMIVCDLPKNRITTKGIVGDKFAFTWNEIHNVEKSDETLVIHYKYRIFIMDIKLTYRIDDLSIIDEAYRIIDNNIIKDNNNGFVN